MKRTILSTLLILFAGGCAKLVVDGHSVYKDLYDRWSTEVKERAKFDFDCPVEKLQTTVVAERGGGVEQFGVSGCDHRGVYVRTMSGWVLNAADKEQTSSR